MVAQNTSTQGKEFWLSFMHNGFKDHSLGGWVINQVLISAKRDCTGTVSNPLTGWSREFSVNANNITPIEIPDEAQGYHNGYEHEVILERGIKVSATDTISVYSTNIAYVSFDASFVLPVESLGDEYIVQSANQSVGGSNTYVSENETTAFLIVATEDNTEVDITPSVNTLGGHPANQTFTITMNAGETYHVRSTRSGASSTRDLSGTHILAADCKRIAVFNGNTVTCIPIDQGNGYDHVFEQAMPLRSWGKNFVVTSSKNRRRDFIKITSSANDNTVTMNGEPLVTLQAMESYTFYMWESEGSCYLQTAQPSAVYLYNNSSYDRYLGDPSMVWIAPVEQRINDVTFSTFDHPNIDIETHSVNIIVYAEDIANVYFDGQQVSPLLFHHVNGNDNYSYARMDISHGVHRITCENGFNAHVYGFGDAKGYAYLVGSNAKNLSTSLTINDEIVLPDGTYRFCANHEITFYAEVNYNDYELIWDFGDGTTSTQNPTTHTYLEPRIYNASVSITTNEGGCTGSASNITYFNIDASQDYHIYNDEVCEGELYSGFGFNNVHILNDTILARLQDNPIHSECQDSVLVYITAHPNYHIPISDSRCWTGQPGVYDDHGFSFIYDHPDVYERQLALQSVNGCDSILTLTLTVGDFEVLETETQYKCYEDTPSFLWLANNQTYYEDGYYTDTLPSGECYAIYSLDLHFMQIPEETHLYDTTCTPYDWEISGHTYHFEVSGDYYHDDNLAPFPCSKRTWLHLVVDKAIDNPIPEVVESCNEYTWNNVTYTEPGYYSATLEAGYCDSIVHLNLTLKYTPKPVIAYAEDDYYKDGDTLAVITNTEFFSFQYDFFIEDSIGHFNDWDSCVWRISKDTWMLEPNPSEYQSETKKSYCRVYVGERDDAPVELSCTVYNHHCEPYSIKKRFYLKSSFFGIDEQDAFRSDFSVVPNPNNGEMEFYFEQLTGKVTVKVYDMRGSVIDNIETYNYLNSNTLHYNLTHVSPGIYFFVATAKEGTIAKKVIIE